VRGSGFTSGAVASFGGLQAATTFIDENTLTAVLPALPPGWQDATVSNSNGDSYTARSLFQVLGGQPTPAITGFSPASGTVGISENPIEITILGSGFADYDAVEINGEPVESAFVNSTSIQATIPYWLTGKTGSVPFTVVPLIQGPRIPSAFR